MRIRWDNLFAYIGEVVGSRSTRDASRLTFDAEWRSPTEAPEACPHNLPRSDHVRIVQAENMLREFANDFQESAYPHDRKLELLARDVKDWFERKRAVSQSQDGDS